jgi:hypothetical protein
LNRGNGEVPSFPVLTVANTRRGRPLTARSPDEFERELGMVEWFAHLGEQSPWDGSCARIFAWDQWPGPEDPLVEAFSCASQERYDRAFAASPLPASDLQHLFDRGHSAVTSLARNAVPFDPEEDAWHGPTQCVWQAAYTGGLIMCVLGSGWAIPDDLVEEWNWYCAGHWPSGFASDDPTARPDHRSGSQLSFPRWLLVY